jgi:DNA adenine methylase
MDARYNRKDMIERIERIARLRNKISLYRLDAAQLLSKVVPALPKRSLIYLDPPYYVKGKGLYENHYSHEDHEKIASQVAALEHYWIVSYDNVSEIRAMYGQFRFKVFGLKYSAQNRYEGSEVMFFSNRLKKLMEVVPSRARAA